MRLSVSIALVAVAFAAGVVRAADSVPQDSSQALAPAVQTALKGLASEDFSTRRKAEQQLEAALAQEAIALASEEDAEGQARLYRALEFEDGLVRWVQYALQSSKTDRDAQLRLISHPDVQPILSEIFSAQISQRVEGVGKLAMLDLPGVDGLLGHMIDDEDREVADAAMEAVWDKKPTVPLVDALWRRAVEAGVTRSLQIASPPFVARSFRGHPLPGAITTSLSLDGNIAADVLVHFETPLVKDKLILFFRQAAADVGNPAATNGQLLAYGTLNPSIRNAYTLLQHYKPVEVTPSLFILATCRPEGKSIYMEGANKCYATNRTAALATLVLLTDQNEEDYHLKKLDRGTAGTVWVCSSDMDEEAAVAKLRAWWSENGSRYGAQSKAE